MPITVGDCSYDLKRKMEPPLSLNFHFQHSYFPLRLYKSIVPAGIKKKLCFKNKNVNKSPITGIRLFFTTFLLHYKRPAGRWQENATYLLPPQWGSLMDSCPSKCCWPKGAEVMVLVAVGTGRLININLHTSNVQVQVQEQTALHRGSNFCRF